MFFVFSDVFKVPLNERINKFGRLTDRVVKESVDKLQNMQKEADMEDEEKVPETYISIEDFQKIDLRIASIIAARVIEESDKLIELELDIGNRRKTVFAGIKSNYEASKLVGRKVICVANLKPRKMRFGVSEGMILAASGDDDGLFLLGPDDGAEAGMVVR